MRGNEFLDKMGLIDPAYVEAADEKPNQRKSVWVKWGVMVACLCLVAVSVFAAYRFRTAEAPADPQNEHSYMASGSSAQKGDSQTQDSVAYGFYLDGNSTAMYFPISFDECVRYGLVPNGATGLDGSNRYQITEDDLGSLMGTVTACGDEAIIGSQVYHFVKYPEYDSICIADTLTGYAFYVCSWLTVPVEIGDTSDAVLAAYGLPNSLEKMEVLAPDFQYLFDIDNETTIEAILEILSGKVNIGHEEGGRRFAQAWYDANGNDGISYSEELGSITASEISLFDKAHELWNEGECIIKVTTDRGFELTVDYFPAVRVFICGDGYYELSTDEVEFLNSLLQI